MKAFSILIISLMINQTLEKLVERRLEEIIKQINDLKPEPKSQESKEDKPEKKEDKEDRKLFLPFGDHGVSPPMVSPPPAIFDTGKLPIQPVFNLMHYPNQYSTPQVDYAYPTVLNPYYNNILPYGQPFMHLNPHALSAMGMYNLTPYNLSMMNNGFSGMMPYMNPMQPGMTFVNNSSQNWTRNLKINPDGEINNTNTNDLVTQENPQNSQQNNQSIPIV
jgi:hypothetical protein